ncbi:MAG TPA: DUF3488 domain-containing protein, partial [Acidimicrobiales bacterium]|nr:DUF3488 domain-containing protein [Acidimicrobiales bacterium]
MTAPTLERGAPPEARPASPLPVPRRPSQLWRRLGREAAFGALMMLSASAFSRDFSSSGWVAPVLITIAGVTVVAAITRRTVRVPIVGPVLDVLAVVLFTVWTVIPGSTVGGIPWKHSWHVTQRAFDGLIPEMQKSLQPAPPTVPFVLAATLGIGILTLLGAWFNGRLRQGGWAAVPALVAFVGCCVLGTSHGRTLSVTVETAALGAWLLLDRAADDRQSTGWLGGRRPPGRAWPGRAGVRLLALAAMVALVVTAAQRGGDGAGALGWAPSGGGHTRIIVTPMVSLTTRLHRESNRDVFTVRSPVPSYWQLTTLDVYSGSTWQTGRASYDSFSSRLPGSQVTVPAGTRRVRETIHIQTLDSPWLPLAFTPIAVSGATDAQYNAATGSLLTKRPTANGMTYTVTSLEYLPSLDPRELEGAPAPTRADAPAGSLELPDGIDGPSVPSSVLQLARTIVAGKRTEYAKALALQDFFHGPEFSYSLDPPSDGSGVGA